MPTLFRPEMKAKVPAGAEVVVTKDGTRLVRVPGPP